VEDQDAEVMVKKEVGGERGGCGSCVQKRRVLRENPKKLRIHLASETRKGRGSLHTRQKHLKQK